MHAANPDNTTERTVRTVPRLLRLVVLLMRLCVLHGERRKRSLLLRGSLPPAVWQRLLLRMQAAVASVASR